MEQMHCSTFFGGVANFLKCILCIFFHDHVSDVTDMIVEREAVILEGGDLSHLNTILHKDAIADIDDMLGYALASLFICKGVFHHAD